MTYNPKRKEIFTNLSRYSRYTFTEQKWRAIKIDHRRSGSECQTKLYVDFNELVDRKHPCGSYSASKTIVYASKDQTDIPATGFVDSFRFVWL